MKDDGFTLIELMLVVIIIGILVAVAVPRLAGRSEEARKTAARADIEGALSLALDLYKFDNGRYPTNEQGLEALRSKPTTSPIPPNWKGPYLKKRVPKDPWGNSYIYTSPGIHSEDFDLESYGPDGIDGGGDDIESWE